MHVCVASSLRSLSHRNNRTENMFPPPKNDSQTNLVSDAVAMTVAATPADDTAITIQ